MVSTNDVQTAVIGLLTGTYAVTELVHEEVREDEWQGTDFVYPALRVQITNLMPEEDGTCRETKTFAQFTIQCYSEADSSKQCGTLANTVVSAIFGQVLTRPYMRSLRINVMRVVPPYRTAPRIWRSDVQAQCHIYETVSS
jgi:hypothetical protein